MLGLAVLQFKIDGVFFVINIHHFCGVGSDMLIALKVFGSMQKGTNKLVPQTYDEKFALHLKETEFR